ncbi:uncharacterized protein LY89DRAFT_686203 [Mollisia scopiformis]|uniref:Uncharacterized protein n=1 Tax=Mollisia scopiformis TaxID=149040 RepID=A0A194X5K9_MOLSC|nr:uncharacterized protein LY89DRAFT_686203 [Mollisia scopiformis]KUJ15455.1 hypothetical protein LY89DRAFT_686203 [Mollisia scopiformis]
MNNFVYLPSLPPSLSERDHNNTQKNHHQPKTTIRDKTPGHTVLRYYYRSTVCPGAQAHSLFAVAEGMA